MIYDKYRNMDAGISGAAKSTAKTSQFNVHCVFGGEIDGLIGL